MPRIRSRVSNADLYLAEELYITGSLDREYVVFVDRETTIDEEHPWQWLRTGASQKNRDYWSARDVGGEFTSRKTRVRLVSNQNVHLKSGSYRGQPLYKFTGPLIPARPATGTLKSDVVVNEPFYPGVQVASFDAAHNSTDSWVPVGETDEELAQLGTKLLSSLAPTAPHNSVFTSLGELRNDGLPSVPFLSFLKGGKLPEKVGGEYLNYQFGIAPTVSDVKSILKTVSEADKLWKQYKRDSGRLVRRRMDMDPEISTVTEPFHTESGALPPLGTRGQMWSSIGPLMRTTTTTRKRWFSAAYLYYVDDASLKGMEGYSEKFQYLYGWKPDPSAVYNLTAWSWLLDWFTNTGDVIDNISMYLQDPFLTRRAYIMEETSVVRTVWQELVDNTGLAHLASIEFTTNLKKRRRVNPFHFGLTDDELDARQLSILAALGMTRFSNPGSM
jgi:hypothetical protein